MTQNDDATHLPTVYRSSSGHLIFGNLSIRLGGPITLLQLPRYKHVKFLDVRGNKLTNLYPVRLLRALTRLDASDNEITTSCELTGLDRLEVVDLSRNKLVSIGKGVVIEDRKTCGCCLYTAGSPSTARTF